MVQPVPLAKLIGTRLRELRERAGVRQEQIAASARQAGFQGWTQATVAAVESGRRRLSLEEFLVLPTILEWAGVGQIPLADLLSDGLAALSPHAVVGAGTAVSAETLRAMLSGRAAVDMPQTPKRLDTPKTQEVRRGFGVGDLSPERVYRVALASQGGAEVHAARVLGCSPLAVALAAERTWRRSLTEERDARVNQRVGLDDFAAGVDAADRRGLAHPVSIATVQAHRGHVTRDLIEQLRPVVKAVTSKKRRGKGGAR